MLFFPFALILATFPLNVPVDCTTAVPEIEHFPPRPAQHRRRSTTTGRFPPKLKGRKGINQDSLVFLPVRAKTANFVSIFDLRGKQFLCRDSKAEWQHGPRRRNMADCLFRDIRQGLELQGDTLYYWLPLEEAAGLTGLTGRPESPKSFLAVLERLRDPLVSRQRRSESRPGPDPVEQDPQLSEQDQAGAVSKETITSCDDPLEVLHSSGPVSPIKTNTAERAEQE